MWQKVDMDPIVIILLLIILMFRLGGKGRAYREEKRIANYNKRQATIRQAKLQGLALTPEQIEQQKKDKLEAQYRKQLEKEGYNEELITTILPTLMNDK